MGRPFVHEHRDFAALLSIVSRRREVAEALVEKDYWITHTLWAIQHTGLELRFKGGTSLSKSFGLIERFSEDLDVKITADGLPAVTNWTSNGIRAVRTRKAFFRALGERLRVPGAEVNELLRDVSWRQVTFAVRYPSLTTDRLPEGIRPFVQLEVGSARVTPGEERPISSWVHDHLFEETPDLAVTFTENRLPGTYCVSPAVTLLEKVEAITRLSSRAPFEPATVIRHYEDAVRILRWHGLGSSAELSRLLDEMRQDGDIRRWPTPDDPAFDPEALPDRWRELERAWGAIQPMFWGERIPLTECATAIRGLIGSLG